VTQIGDRLRLARVESGMTLRQTEEETGLSKDTISRLERGTRNPQPLTIAKLAKAYGRTTEEFLESPKEPSRPSLASPEEDDDEGRLARAFMIQRPTDAERIWFIEKAVDILRHYYELASRVHSNMNDDLAWHGSSYVWHGFFFNTLQPAMERDGVLLHASVVVHSKMLEVSEREREACEKLLNYDFDMQNLIWDMREVDEKNNARVREDVSRGLAQASEWLENISKNAPSRRGSTEQ
jgi:transcriptional regulator with XRE-family HTH domain